MIRTCETCQENSKRKAKDPVLAREIPLTPWTLIKMDLFTLEDHTYLLVVDIISRFPVIRILSNEMSWAMINALKGIYSELGLPKSSAYNHQSVSSVECMVQTIKQIIIKNAENAWLALLIYRSTNIPGIDKSPSELLNARKYRTNLPMINLHKKSNESKIEKLSDKHNLPMINLHKKSNESKIEKLSDKHKK